MKILSVILCGGSGTRLWPLSRQQYPKQLLPLVGSETLLQATVGRVEARGLTAGSTILPPLVVANEEYRFLVAEQLRQMHADKARIVLEPIGRNTAPALTVAALLAQAEDPLLVVMPADHVIGKLPVFRQALSLALAYGEQGKLVTFGIVPTAPETGFGYIRKGNNLEGGRVRDWCFC